VSRTLTALAALLVGVGSAGAARAQAFAPPAGSESDVIAGQSRFKSPQRFAFELRFGPYRPDVDSEFNGARAPYQDYFGSGNRLLTQIEVDYELWHRLGTAAVGLGLGYFTATGTAPLANGQPSKDSSTFKIIPLSVSAVYRFDYFLEQRGFPVVPYGKVGLDWAYWQITDGNGEIASDGQDGRGRGGTLGWHAAAGLAFVLDFVDPDAARSFDADMGVNHTSLVFQVTHADISGLGMSDRLRVGDTTWSLGIMFQF
jgi:hypothetical protein